MFGHAAHDIGSRGRMCLVDLLEGPGAGSRVSLTRCHARVPSGVITIRYERASAGTRSRRTNPAFSSNSQDAGGKS